MSQCPFGFLSRRSFIKSAGSGVSLLAAASSGIGALSSSRAAEAAPSGGEGTSCPGSGVIPFCGRHQAGIATPQQKHTYFASFDLVTKNRAEVIQLLKDWTLASESLTQGKSVEIPSRPKALEPSPSSSPLPGRAAVKPEMEDTPAYGGISTADSGEALGLAPSRLTLTFGFGSGLFASKDGTDRYGLSQHRPEALVDLPKFHGDELIEAKTGGDLSVQACSDDCQVAFHAIRQLARIAAPLAQIRWVQTGFLSGGEGPGTPRNLMGFKDGTQQPHPREMNEAVWVGQEGPSWMRGGSYLVTRRIRIALEHWDSTEVDFQEQVIGRYKKSGAPLGQKHEKEALNLTARDPEGNPFIPENSHVRLASREANGGSQMLRRGYSYNEGVNFTAERWPPWRQGLEYDAGLFFVAYQSDPRTAFIKIFNNMSKLDALNQFVTHVGSGLFACPPGVAPGEYIGQRLFETA